MTSKRTLTPDQCLAIGLSRLFNRDLESDGHGYQTLAALRDLDESGNFEPDDHIWYRGEFLVQLGFAEREAERGQGAWRYKITPMGKVFLGKASHGWKRPGWITLVGDNRADISFDLRNAEHVSLMVRMLTAGWHLPTPKQPVRADI